MLHQFLTRQKGYAAEEETNDEEEEIVRLVAEYTLTTKQRSKWAVDSGAICHMRKDEELLDQVSVLDAPQEIKVGDGYSFQATSTGSAILGMNLPNGKAPPCKVTDVCLYLIHLTTF